ncbi:MAG: DUF5615 family PIN-like protein [Caldilineaceae bacterium]
MQFLANENFPIASVRILRNAGHNVVAIIEDNPGIDDATILAQAVAEGRIILTFDSDYGNLIFRDGLPAAAVIYLRYEPLSPQEPAFHILRLLTIEELALPDRFTVVDRERTRQRPLP